MNRHRSLTLALAALVAAACICQVPATTPSPGGGGNPDPSLSDVPATLPFDVASPPPDAGRINGADGGEIAAECNGTKGAATFEKDSFPGSIDFKISCLDENEISDLEEAVKKKTEGTGLLLGAIRIEPHQKFDRNVLLRIPLFRPQPKLAGRYVDLYIYPSTSLDELEPIQQAQVDEFGVTATASVDHFSLFALVETIPPTSIPSLVPADIPTLTFTPIPPLTSIPFTCADALGCAAYKPGDPITVTAILSFSGPAYYVALSEDILSGIEAAVLEYSPLGGHAIQIEKLDDSCKKEEAEYVAGKAEADPYSVGVIGTVCDETADAILPILSKANRSLVSPANTAAYLTQPGFYYDGFFRVVPPDSSEAKGMAIFAYRKMGFRYIGIAYQKTDFSAGLATAFKEEFERLGGKIVATEAVPGAGSDIKAILYKIADQKPDAFYFPLPPSIGASVVSQAHEFFPKIPRMGTFEMKSNGDFPSKAGTGAIGMYYPQVFPSLATDAKDLGYDAAQILLAAVASVMYYAPDGSLVVGRSALREALSKTYRFPGKTGELTCEKYGDCSNPYVLIYLYRKGAFEPYYYAYP